MKYEYFFQHSILISILSGSIFVLNDNFHKNIAILISNHERLQEMIERMYQWVFWVLYNNIIECWLQPHCYWKITNKNHEIIDTVMMAKTWPKSKDEYLYQFLQQVFTVMCWGGNECYENKHMIKMITWFTGNWKVGNDLASHKHHMGKWYFLICLCVLHLNFSSPWLASFH